MKNTLNVMNLAYKINQNELGVKYLETCLSITTRIILNFSYNDVYPADQIDDETNAKIIINF